MTRKPNNDIIADIRRSLILAVYKKDICLIEDVLHVIDEEFEFDDSWEDVLDSLSEKSEYCEDDEEES